MSWLEKATIFYKLAADKSGAEEEYEKLLVDLHSYKYRISDVVRTAFKYRQRGDKFFKIEDFLPIIYEKLKDERFNSYELDTIRYYKDLYNQILKYCLIELMKDPIESLEKWFTPRIYFLYEEVPGIPDDVLRKAQTVIIRTLFTDVKSLENYETDDQEEIERIQTMIAKELASLLERAKKFPPNFLQKLLQHFGPGLYAATMGEMRGLEGAKIEMKYSYTKHDIAYLFSHRIRSIDKAGMQRIIEKSNSQAKEYLRGYLYEDMSRMYEPDALFALAEDLTPINLQYQQVPWPSEIRIIVLDEVKDPNAKLAWQKFFQDFQIFPH